MEISMSRYFKVTYKVFKMLIENIFFSDELSEKLEYILRILLCTHTNAFCAKVLL